MGSVLEEQNNTEMGSLVLEEEDNILKQYEEDLTEFLKFNNEGTSASSSSSTSARTSSKRKRKNEEDASLNILMEIFLRILYPISRCMTKSITVGLVKGLNYKPNAILTYGSKMLFLSNEAWESFNKHLHLIECYLEKNLFGKKTAIRLLDCDIEIDILKCKGELQVRFRDLTKHEDKIQLTREEFYMLCCATLPITRYMDQLMFSSSVLKDYLKDAMEHHPNAQILYGPIDTSIFNRMPYEVEMWRSIREYEEKKEKIDEKKTENNKENEVDNVLAEQH